MSQQERYFDLNMEDVLDDWEIYHAIREIIANALDEQVLTKTKDIEITKEDSVHKIRDFGRGLRYVHFTQNEDQEKLKNPGLVIGKFGVGLKDALATLNRHKIDVNIKTKHGDITLEKTAKHGFDDITTLHAVFSEPTEEIEGTEFVLKGCTDADITKAKNLFLKFSRITFLSVPANTAPPTSMASSLSVIFLNTMGYFLIYKKKSWFKNIISVTVLDKMGNFLI